MSTQKKTFSQTRNERGETLISVQMGLVIGAIILGAAWAFVAHAADSGAETSADGYQSISVSQGARHIQSRVAEADAVAEVGYDRLVFDTVTAEGASRTYYEITSDGELLTAEVPIERGAAYEMDEDFTADKTLVRNLNTETSTFAGSDGAGGFTYESDTKLVKIVLVDADGAEIQTAAAIG